ncbi:MAG: adenosine deaminase [Acidobacteria bacterium]|nr:adenosine deaminase [Acidobacteriota bacterium]
MSPQRALLPRRTARSRVEIHLHLEGSISPARLRALWEVSGRDPSLPSNPESLYRHRSFPEFLQHFAQITKALNRPEDLAQITTDLCRRLKRQGVAAAEVFFSPVILTRRGIPFLEMLDAMDEAAARERARGGPALAWILDGVRQWGPGGMEENLRCAAMAAGRILGIGIGGDERSVPAEAFAALFHAARQMGLRTVAHAGEFDGPESVWKAVEVLGAERIGHGIRSAEDPLLLAMLRRRRIPLEVCPTSNLRTGVVRRWHDHPLPRLVAAGIRITVNTDDPALFRTSLHTEYQALQRRLGLGEAAALRIQTEGVRASFLSPSDKRRILQRVKVTNSTSRLIGRKTKS